MAAKEIMENKKIKKIESSLDSILNYDAEVAYENWSKKRVRK